MLTINLSTFKENIDDECDEHNIAFVKIGMSWKIVFLNFFFVTHLWDDYNLVEILL